MAAINSIQPRSQFFDLITESDGSTSLVLQKELNREVAEEYHLTIMARDQGKIWHEMKRICLTLSVYEQCSACSL